MPMTITLEVSSVSKSGAAPLRAAPTQMRSVVVHSGARDGYQVARALAEADMLESLVTDLFWPGDRGWARAVARLLPKRIQKLLGQRSEPHIGFERVRLCAGSGLAALMLGKLQRVPFSLRRGAARHADATLGRVAGQRAARTKSHLVTYSYYGYDAFTHYPGPGILFQLHPHPLSVRRILREELSKHPDCAESLRQEWELALPEEDFQRLVQETSMPSHILAASSFTRSTLVENGIDRAKITVIPYGVDTRRFVPDSQKVSTHGGKLRLLFVGRINQRKGVKYLLEALKLLKTRNVEVTVCGRVVDGLQLFEPFASQVVIRPSVSEAELLAAYRSADLFVFPSVAEGFGQVLLESLASGLPILATTHTAAPDLIEDGVQGFVVEPRSPELLAERIEWALDHPRELQEMGVKARVRAQRFTWERFRAQIVSVVQANQSIYREVR